MMVSGRAPGGRAGPGPDVGVLGRVGWAPVRVSNCVLARVGEYALGVPCRAGSAPVTGSFNNDSAALCLIINLLNYCLSTVNNKVRPAVKTASFKEY